MDQSILEFVFSAVSTFKSPSHGLHDVQELTSAGELGSGVALTAKSLLERGLSSSDGVTIRGDAS